MKKLSLILAMIMLFTVLSVGASADWAPKQPITIMNHVAAGGGMDLYTRKWVELAAKYTDATVERL